MVLIKATEQDFDRIFEIMDASFPNTEMRNKDGQKRVFENEKYTVVMDENKKGFISYWNFEKAIYVEHFAVEETMRGGGHGKRMIETFLNEIGMPAFLEVEPPESDITKRRISFYKRIGFKLNDFPYIQPPMREEEGPIELKIMSFPNIFNDEQFEKYRDVVYREVYNFKK